MLKENPDIQDLYDHIQEINAKYTDKEAEVMNVLHKIRKGIDLVLSWACAALFALMVIVGTYQIVVRYFSIAQVPCQRNF